MRVRVGYILEFELWLIRSAPVAGIRRIAIVRRVGSAQTRDTFVAGTLTQFRVRVSLCGRDDDPAVQLNRGGSEAGYKLQVVVDTARWLP